MYSHEYYLANKARYQESQKRYRAENPEKVREMGVNWRRRNEGRIYRGVIGYDIYVGFNHPACHAFGLTAHHRIIMWDMLGGEDAQCHWCDKDIHWFSKSWNDNLVVDHVDRDRGNNEYSNLVPSCNMCNILRDREQIGPCEFDGCDRMQVSNHLCSAHNNQRWRGIDLKPIRRRELPTVKTDTERECTVCKEVKSLEDFYKSGGRVKARCKKCTIIQNNAANKRRALEGR